tara:strand:- start:10439 stop:11260 length:822 start_codon:yes stop_codon:yes gene_type:complete
MEKKNLNQSSCICCGSKRILKSFISWSNINYSICQNCNSAYQNPIIEQSYNDNYWVASTDPDGNKRDLTKEREIKIKNWYGNIFKFINTQEPGKILDVGTGLGFLLSAISPKWDKYGIDVSQFSKSYISNKYPKINFVKTSLQNYDFPKSYFDIIISYHVIEHLLDPDDHLNKIHYLLKDGGYLIVGSPNNQSFVAKVFQKNFRLYGEGHLCVYNRKSLGEKIKKHKFQIVNTEYPFFKTSYFNVFNLLKLFNINKVSPPFYGNIMTLYAQKK